MAIVGRANVGKSSLFNALIGRREAIVAAEAGTTRDRLTIRANYKDKDFWLVDTAGVKTPDDEFELTIQDQIAQTADTADLILVVVEANISPTAEDRRVATMALKTKKQVLLVVNKSDKKARLELSDWKTLGIKKILPVSASHKTGLDDLIEEISQGLPKGKIPEAEDIIGLAILGRPNVGKSSLFNSLVAKQQALVAEQAGTTRDVNRIIIRYHNQEIEVADTAGIRRSGKIERGIERFSVIRALAAIEQSDTCLLVMDANELNTKLDQKIAGLIKEAGKGLIVVVNKWDTVIDRLDKDTVTEQVAASFEFAPWAPLIFTSALTGLNVTKIYEFVLQINENRRQKFKTSDLNNWLRRVVNAHEPPPSSGHFPKLKYMVQEEGTGLPSFKIFGSNINFLHWSYRRYLERQFRERWPLEGTPLKFWFIEKT